MQLAKIAYLWGIYNLYNVNTQGFHVFAIAHNFIDWPAEWPQLEKLQCKILLLQDIKCHVCMEN